MLVERGGNGDKRLRVVKYGAFICGSISKHTSTVTVLLSIRTRKTKGTTTPNPAAVLKPELD